MKIFLSVYAHYPESINSTVISDRFLISLSKFFKCELCDVLIKTAPHNESELIVIDIINDNDLIKKENLKIKLKEIVLDIFNNSITDIRINL